MKLVTAGMIGLRLVVLTVILAAATARADQVVGGIPRIVDGDTVELQGIKMRLVGIDAPETDQTCLDGAGKKWSCGLSARDALASYGSGRAWECTISGFDRYRRALASCRMGGDDVQSWMVRSGWALSFVRYSRTYDSEETQARAAKAGIWSGAFVAPWDWRSRNARTTVLGAFAVPTGAQAVLLGADATGPAIPACAVKGNVNRKGECIYHLPGSRHYDTVEMDLAKGKRWFCTAEEAEAAGCRKPK